MEKMIRNGAEVMVLKEFLVSFQVLCQHLKGRGVEENHEKRQ
jgi:hypothetical protein